MKIAVTAATTIVNPTIETEKKTIENTNRGHWKRRLLQNY